MNGWSGFNVWRWLVVAAVFTVGALCADNSLALPLSWQTMQAMPAPRSRAATAVVNNKIFVLGGDVSPAAPPLTSSIVVYDPQLNSWQQQGSLSAPRFAAAATVSGDTIYVVGGAAAYPPTPVNTILAYNTVTGETTLAATLNTPRMKASAVLLNNLIYVIGGNSRANSQDTRLASIEECNPATGVCVEKPIPLPAAREMAAVVVVNGRLLIMGGLDSGGYPTNTVWAYDPADDISPFTTRSPMPESLAGWGGGGQSGKVYLIGGVPSSGTPPSWNNDILEYDDLANQWQVAGTVPTSRYAMGVGIANNTLYVMGGDSSSSPPTATNLVVNEAAALSTPVAQGIITTVAGNGVGGYSGDGVPAVQTSLAGPEDVAVDATGNLYIADSFNNRIRKVNGQSGLISTVAGTGAAEYSGDGGQAMMAGLSRPFAVALDKSNNLYITDNGNYRVRKVDLTSGVITTVAGNGTSGYSGDGGPATDASLGDIRGLALDSIGNMYIADCGSNRIRKVDHATGVISTVVTANHAEGVTLDSSDTLYYAETWSNRIVRVEKGTGATTVVAGNGAVGSGGDGGPATQASLNFPHRVVVDNNGIIYIADTRNNRIRKVSTGGIITTVAGTGAAGFSGDGGSATAATISDPKGISADANGNVYFTDTFNNRVRTVTFPPGSNGWYVQSVNPTEPYLIDWPLSQHGPVAGGNYLKVGSTFYYIMGSSTGSWTGPDYAQAILYRCDQSTGAVLFDPMLPDMTGAAGLPITLYTTWPQSAIIAVSPASHDFGAIPVDSAAGPLVVTIANNGSAPLAISSIAPGGIDASQFTVQPGSCPTLSPTLEPGSDCTVLVTFVPNTAGSKSATLDILSSAPASPAVSISLAGTAQGPVDTTPPVAIATPPGGAFISGQSIALTANEAATIYFTLDGSEPTPASAIYSGPIGISATTTLKFLARDTAGNSGTVKTETYTFTLAHPLAITVSGCGTVYYSTGDSCTGSCSQPFASGTTITLTPSACGGSYFAGWSSCDQLTGNQCTLTMNAARGLVATFYPGSGGETAGWTGAGQLATKRFDHAATPLQDGTVLVIGGYNENASIATAERYNPATDSWSPAGTMTAPRGGGHTATLLPNGKVLVAAGGSITGYTADAELYDPATGSWSQAGPLTTARSSHSATLLPNGKVLVAGGWGYYGYLASAELYDPATNSWTPTGSMTVGRQVHSATLLPNGRVLVTGGSGEYGDFASAELYDPDTGSWSQTGAMAAAHGFEHTATLLPDGRLLVVGGHVNTSAYSLASAELYDPATGSWSSAGAMANARYGHTATLLVNNRVLVTGGVNDTMNFLASAELYDPATGNWSSTASMATPRASHIAIRLPNGKVLAAGGNNGTTYHASAELYGPAIDLIAPATKASPPGGTYATPQTVTLTTNEPASIHFTLDGSTPTTASAVYTNPLTISATTVLKFFARDPAGNSEGVKTETYVIAVPLLLTLTGNGAGSVQSAPAPGINCFAGACNHSYPLGTVVTLTATAAADSVFAGWGGDCTGSGQCQLTMETGKTVTATFTPSGDTTAPTITAFTMPGTATTLSVPVITFSASDTVGVTGYLITESPLPPAPQAAGWSSSPPASHTFVAPGNCYAYAWARDAAGNVSASGVAIVNITLEGTTDTVAPLITAFLLPSVNSLTVPITTLAVTDNVGVTGYIISENGATPLPGDPRWQGTLPAAHAFTTYGTKTLYAWARDGAGNVSARVGATCTLMDPDQQLDTLLTGWPANPMPFAPSTFAFTANRGGTTFECSLDGQGYFPCASPVSFGALANGSHTFNVRAKESGGSHDMTPASYTWTVYIPIARINLTAFTSVANAYAASSDGLSLEIKGLDLTENLVFDRPIAITLKGGYDAGYAAATGTTTIHGTLQINSGTVIIDNIAIM